MSENNNKQSTINNQLTSNWFESWFDTKYYHILYKERNDEEAQLLMDNLTHYLNLPEDAKILDLACGKGRHAIYLNSLGFDVTGADLSENSILEASKFSNEKLHFKVHDMRETCDEKYDAIFNLFTSFGYFEDDADNYKTIKAIHNSLTETGFAVIDFMNADYVIENLGILFPDFQFSYSGSNLVIQPTPSQQEQAQINIAESQLQNEFLLLLQTLMF